MTSQDARDGRPVEGDDRPETAHSDDSTRVQPESERRPADGVDMAALIAFERRRREAALRLPPLTDGRRDPLLERRR